MRLNANNAPFDYEIIKRLPMTDLENLSSSSFGKDTNLIDSWYKKKKADELKKALLSLSELKGWPKNWNDYGAHKPVKAAISHAEKIIKAIFDLSNTLKFGWKIPNITASSEGDVMFEWWVKKRKLTFYINPKFIHYIKVKGAKFEDMEDGKLNDLNISTYQEIFNWLINE